MPAARTPRRKPHLLYALLAGPLLLGLCAAGLLLYPHPEYRRTGDALYDSAALLILDELARIRPPLHLVLLAALQQGVTRTGDFEIGCLLPLRERFPDDPRCAELLLTLGAVPLEPGGKLQAVEQAPQSPGCLAWLAAGCARNNEDAALEACRRGLAADPDNSLFHYLRAQVLISLGEMDEAAAETRAGNAAPVNAMRWTYPVSRVLEQHWGRGGANDRVAALLYLSSQQPGRYIDYRESGKCLQVAMLIGMQPEDADVFVTMYRRLGQMDGTSPLQLITWRSAVLGLIVQHADSQIPGDTDQLLWTSTPACDREGWYINNQLAQLGQRLDSATGSSTLTDSAGLDLVTGWYALQPSQSPASGLDGALLMLAPELRRMDEARAAVAPLFDCLDPPPFSAWARGEPAGIAVPDGWQPPPPRQTPAGGADAW